MRTPVRFLPGWQRLLVFAMPPLLAAAVLGSALILARASHPQAPPGTGDVEAEVVAPPPAPGLLVDVSGAVVHPGLYRLPRGERVLAAITAAGGLAANADTAHVPNLA